jgi:hypothetical protein
MCGTPAERLNTASPCAAKQIKEPGVRNAFAKDAEQALADTVRCGTDGAPLGSEQPPSFQGTCYNPHRYSIPWQEKWASLNAGIVPFFIFLLKMIGVWHVARNAQEGYNGVVFRDRERESIGEENT